MQGIKNLTQGPINRQLFNLAMPIMATSFIQMAYSLTDMAWVGRLGSEAVAAIGSVGILTWMSGSISLLNKVGSEVSVGQSIGAQSQEDARNFASHNITIALILSLCWGGLLLFSQTLSYVSMNSKSTLPPMPSSTCELFLPDCRSYSFPPPSPESTMRQDVAKFLFHKRDRIDTEYYPRPSVYLRIRTGDKRRGLCNLDCGSKRLSDFRLSICDTGMRYWAVFHSSPA